MTRRQHRQGWLNLPRSIRRLIMLMSVARLKDIPEIWAIEIVFNRDNRPTVWVRFIDD